MLDTTPLFTPLTIKSKTLRNRIVMPPMVQMRPITSPEGIAWYAERARGGVALVIVEATGVARFGADLTVANLTPLVDAVHEAGALIAMQLFPVNFGREATPAKLTSSEIYQTFAHYHIAAQVCAEAGFDGVEPHGAHGYLINRFFSPVQNKREDDWNGSLENRMRFALDIIHAVHPVCADNNMLLLYRHTPVGKGYGIKESLILARSLIMDGVDVLDLSPSSIEAPGDHAAPFMGFGSTGSPDDSGLPSDSGSPRGSGLPSVPGPPVPCIAVNHLDDVNRALEVLNEKRADLIAIGRGLIADPEWPNKVQQGRLDDIVKCIQCDVKCFGNLRKRIPVECTQW